jgi:hypothetical protein
VSSGPQSAQTPTDKQANKEDTNKRQRKQEENQKVKESDKEMQVQCHSKAGSGRRGILVVGAKDK